MEKQDLVKRDYLKGMKNKDIATKHEISENTLKSWIRRGGWKLEKDAKKKGAPQKEKGAPLKSISNVKKQSKRSGGNPNPPNKFTKRNQAARIHGLRAKYFVDTQREIMEDFQDVDIADQLWIQIEIKFSAIIQLQRVMWVPDAEEHLRIQSGYSEGEVSSEAYKVAFAHERFESYINAQSRAMAEYRNLVKYFKEYAHEDDERRFKLDKLHAEVNKIQAEATIAKNKADKLTADSHANQLMQSLIDVMAEDDTHEED